MQHRTCKTKDDNALDDTINDVLDGALDAFNPGGRVQPWRTRSTLDYAFNPGGRVQPLQLLSYSVSVATTVESENIDKTNVPSKGKTQVVGEHNNCN